MGEAEIVEDAGAPDMLIDLDKRNLCGNYLSLLIWFLSITVVTVGSCIVYQRCMSRASELMLLHPANPRLGKD